MLDDGLFRMWYRGSIGASTSSSPTAYATSTDGLHWERTRVGRVEYEGSKHTEAEGIQLTKDLLLRVREQLAS